MAEPFERLTNIGRIMTEHGREVVLALLILVLGLILIRLLMNLIRRLLLGYSQKYTYISTIVTGIHIVLIVFVVASALQYLGLSVVMVRRIILAALLAGIGLLVIFRPYIPTLPFKVGNTIKTGDLLGRVEATTVLNTRIRTFDGKTVFVPNSKILNDYVINFHFTPTRRFEIDVGIRYDQDLVKAKQVLEALLIEDPRVKGKPRPIVYVVNLADSCVELSARGWVENLKYWRTKCDLLEKTKLRFDQEGITIAFPQRDVHLYHEDAKESLSDEEKLLSEENRPAEQSNETI
ncbi:mechanosensitive ion channel family protein [Thermodesulfobacteriota bacterium]